MAEPLRVLIVDSQQENVDFITEQVLQQGSYQFSVAYDGQEGLLKALGEDPDLMIVDINVPGLNGLQILEELNKAQKEIPVILTTFHGSEGAAVQAFRLGAKGYIIKPYRVEEMREAIRRALSERTLQGRCEQLTRTLAQVNRQMEQRLRELSILSSIGRSVTALLDEDRLLTRVVEAAVYITGAEEGFLLLVDEESGELYMRAARGLGEKYARGFRLKVNDSLAGQVVRTGKPVMITTPPRGDRFKVKTGYLVKSLLHVPLKVGESVIGVLSVDHMVEDRAFDNHDLYLLSALADYAAIALESSRLHTRLQQREKLQPEPPPRRQPSAIPTAEQDTQEVLARLQAGREMLTTLKERLSAFELWMDNFAPQVQSVLHAPPASQDSSVTVDLLLREMEVILDSMLDGVLVVDHQDRIVAANQAAEGMLGRKLVGEYVEEACDDPRWSKTYKIVRAAARLDAGEPGSEINGATTSLTIAGRAFRASFRIKPPGERTPGGFVVVLRDITAEREAQRAKDSFIASISQELRTPATSIVGYADLLMGESLGPLEEMQRKFLDRIRANAERIGSLLNNLVGVTMLGAAPLGIKSEVVDLRGVIHEACEVMRASMVAKEQVLDVDIEPELPYIQADPDAMYHVLMNLLHNAHRCSPEGARISLRAEKLADGEEVYALVSIADAGGGTPPQDHKRVFNRFYRSDTPDVPGLGDPNASLPIVKVLVEAHGGRVWLDSKTGVGNTFTLVLPAYREKPTTESISEKST